MNAKWLMSGIVAVAVTAYAPSFVSARDAKPAAAREGRADQGESDRTIKYEELPSSVKETLDRERRDHKISQIMHVRREGSHDFYRVVIDMKGSERVLRIGTDGKMLTEQDAADGRSSPDGERGRRTRENEGRQGRDREARPADGRGHEGR